MKQPLSLLVLAIATATATAIGGLVLWNQKQVHDAVGELRSAATVSGQGGGAPIARLDAGSGARFTDALAGMGALREELARMRLEIGELRAVIEELEALAAQVPPDSGRLFLSDGWMIGEDARQALEGYREKGRAWGPEQVTGEPDTPGAGDIVSAWAPLKQDGGAEWLQLDYDEPVELSEINVLETHNPGAISKVTARLESGGEVVVWEGSMEAEKAPVERVFQVDGSVRARSVTVHMDTNRVPGWNEIDAVEIVGRDQSRQWASGASASSSYADK